jgi:hypothetical protein
MVSEDQRNDQGDEQGDGEVHSACDIVAALRKLADRRDKVKISDAIEAMGERSFGPFLLLPAMIELSPIGGIPGVPTFLALIIAITAFQLLLGRNHLWLPGFLANRSRKSADIRKAADKLEGIAAWLDRWFHGRLPRFTSKPFQRIAAGLVILLTLTVPPLELLPFASSAPMAAIAAFGLALLVGDGLLMLIAAGLSLGAIALGIGLLSTSGVLGAGGEGGGGGG